jgi:hypothetical protein
LITLHLSLNDLLRRSVDLMRNAYTNHYQTRTIRRNGNSNKIAFKTAMNNYQSFLKTNTKTGKLFNPCMSKELILINFNILSMFYAQCDNIGSMYKLAVKVIDDVNSACAGGHLHSH